VSGLAAASGSTFLRMEAKETEAGSRPGRASEQRVSTLQPVLLPPKHLGWAVDPAAPSHRRQP